MTRHRRTATTALIIALAWAPPAWAGPPTEQLLGHVDRAVKILKDPAPKGEAEASERGAALRRIADQIFDFPEIARRSLGSHWDERTPVERDEFVRLFTDLLRRAYLSKAARYDFDTIVLGGETLDGDQAIVRTKAILPQGGELPLDYRMARKPGDRWQVYDIAVGGISLVGNYRAQFNRVIRTSSYEDLVTKLKTNQEFSEPPAASPRTDEQRPR